MNAVYFSSILFQQNVHCKCFQVYTRLQWVSNAVLKLLLRERTFVTSF